MSRRIIGIVIFAICMGFPFTIVKATELDDKDERSLSSVFEKVGTTVKNSVESVGKVTDSTVRSVDETLRDTHSFTQDTLRTVTSIDEEKPVSKVFNQTIDHVESTVSNLPQVVEETTKTIDRTVSDVKDVTEALPELPVVTPVGKEVGKTVEKTTSAVTTTVNQKVEEVAQVPAVLKRKEPFIEERPEAVEVQDEVQSEGGINPDLSTEPFTPKDDVEDEINPSEEHVQKMEMVELQSAMHIADHSSEQLGETLFRDIPAYDGGETSFVVGVSKSGAKNAIENENSRGSMQKELPLQLITSGHDAQNFVITANSTSALSSPSTSGHADVLANILRPLSLSRDAVYHVGRHFSQNVKSQWSNAPPGQPPRFIPFLVNKLTN
ncbi:hypothetical protein QT711_07380 [Sporosarcina saromensis]|uniref:Uncharacterized protein n=1 Tax=Sporosarcina saromensis TaxID=359365 RepID=A0ABU4G9K0_9BACL|nr:hypothetical protein [Sporosarcina saromensis]MDW0113003.1 hypothetical protein [Sporosarcina saromensis]